MMERVERGELHLNEAVLVQNQIGADDGIYVHGDVELYERGLGLVCRGEMDVLPNQGVREITGHVEVGRNGGVAQVLSEPGVVSMDAPDTGHLHS
jgi:hypothetical protein